MVSESAVATPQVRIKPVLGYRTFTIKCLSIYSLQSHVQLHVYMYNYTCTTILHVLEGKRLREFNQDGRLLTIEELLPWTSK